MVVPTSVCVPDDLQVEQVLPALDHDAPVVAEQGALAKGESGSMTSDLRLK